MKKTFIIAYSGNKYKEAPIIYNELNLKGIKTIIEPFCGTSSMSFYLSQQHPKKYKYILNDKDENLMNIYEVMKDETKYKELLDKIKEYYDYVFDNVEKEIQKERYNGLKLNDDLASWVFLHKFYAIRAGLYPLNGNNPRFDIEEHLNLPFVKFLREENIEFCCQDGVEIVKKYKDDESILILLDPPYLNSNNTHYKHRGLDIYPYLFETGLKNISASLYMIVNPIESIHMMFGEYFKKTYPKKYGLSKNKYCKEHVIISNK